MGDLVALPTCSRCGRVITHNAVAVAGAVYCRTCRPADDPDWPPKGARRGRPLPAEPERGTRPRCAVCGIPFAPGYLPPAGLDTCKRCREVVTIPTLFDPPA